MAIIEMLVSWSRRRNEEEGGWSDLASEVLAKLLTAEASGGSRGRPGHAPLIALVRSVDSHATQHVQQVRHAELWAPRAVHGQITDLLCMILNLLLKSLV